MSYEFQLLPNPDNVPGLVTSGYQRQNTNLFIIQTGLDTTEPFDNGAGVISIPAGGIVELNGVMFKLTADIILQKPNINTIYWIAVTDEGNGTATAELVTRPGVWNSTKKGCYLNDGRRTLNWVSRGSFTITQGCLLVYSRNVKGIDTFNLPGRGWYYIQLRSGLGNGIGGNAISYDSPGGGGIATNYNWFDTVIFDDAKSHRVKVGGSGENGSAGFFGSHGGQNHALASGAGGGGGSGGGEETTFDGLSTGAIKGGDGGVGADGSQYVTYDYYGVGGHGGAGGQFGGAGAPGGAASRSQYSVYLPGGGGGGGGAGGQFGGAGAPGGQGGRGGFYESSYSTIHGGQSGAEGGKGGKDGFWSAEGTPGGACIIYKIT